MTPGAGYQVHPGRRAMIGLSDWTLPNLKVTFSAPFQNVAQHESGVIIVSEGGISTVKLDSTRDQVMGVPASVLSATKPNKAGQVVLVTGGEHRGQTYTTISRDGNEWMVDTRGGHAVLDVGLLGLRV